MNIIIDGEASPTGNIQSIIIQLQTYVTQQTAIKTANTSNINSLTDANSAIDIDLAGIASKITTYQSMLPQ